MPRKVFTAGEVLAAADVNSFLQDQAVMTFAGTAARGSAIPSPVEGMVTYLNDSNDIKVYNGSAWVGIPVAGADITSGTIDKARLPSGSILQVINATTSTQATTTSSTFVYSGLEATITPRSTSSKILILASGRVEIVGSAVAGRVGIFFNGQGGSLIAPTEHNIYSEGATDLFLAWSINHLHSPSTTSACTYSLMFRRTLGGASFLVQPSGTPSNLTLIEVA